MAESIEVYFKNQNDAESAQANLRTLKVNHVYVEVMPEDVDTSLFVPFFPRPVDSGTVASGGVGSVPPILPEIRKEVSGPNYPSYLLYVEVETEDYERVLSILEEHDCYVRDET